MEVLPISGKDILNRLGTIKNELLIFAVVICIILNASAAYGRGRLPAPSWIQELEELILVLSSVVIALLALGFYIYAYLNLPPSSRAWIFSNGVRTMGKEHENQRPEAAKGKEGENRRRKAARAGRKNG